MKLSRRLRFGVLGAAGIAAVAGAVLIGSSAPALASGSSPASDNTGADASAPVTHPDQDWAGSQIVRHEGVQTDAAVPDSGYLHGLDVSAYQGNVDWSAVAKKGAKFAYVKATEGTGYTNPYFAQQYNGSYQAGLKRGAYAFALPNKSGGKAQADYLVAHGGGWSKDGKTLPPMIDLEYNPYGSTCYGLSQAGMVSWIKAFSDEIHSRTKRWPTIYTSASWWSQCTGNKGDFSSTNPLFTARYASSAGSLPFHWTVWTIWQYADSGTFPGDQDYFNGGAAQLLKLADG